jgi:hypothetical protein
MVGKLEIGGSQSRLASVKTKILPPKITRKERAGGICLQH